MKFLFNGPSAASSSPTNRRFGTKAARSPASGELRRRDPLQRSTRLRVASRAGGRASVRLFIWRRPRSPRRRAARSRSFASSPTSRCNRLTARPLHDGREDARPRPWRVRTPGKRSNGRRFSRPFTPFAGVLAGPPRRACRTEAPHKPFAARARPRPRLDR